MEEGNYPPQQPPSSSPAPQLQFGPHEPSCSLWTTGRTTKDSAGAAGAFFLPASISMRLPIKFLEGFRRDFLLSSRELLFYPPLERGAGHRTHDLIDELPALEEKEGRGAPGHAALPDLRLLR